MQRRHYEFIASTIAKMNPLTPNAQGYKQALAEHFADELHGTNRLFNRDRFIKACMTGQMGKGRSHKNVQVRS